MVGYEVGFIDHRGVAFELGSQLIPSSPESMMHPEMIGLKKRLV